MPHSRPELSRIVWNRAKSDRCAMVLNTPTPRTAPPGRGLPTAPSGRRRKVSVLPTTRTHLPPGSWLARNRPIPSHQPVRRVSRRWKSPSPVWPASPLPHSPFRHNQRIRAAVNNPAPYCGRISPAASPPPRCSDASSPARARRRQRGAAAGRRPVGAGRGSGPEGMGMASGDAHGPDGGPTQVASSRHPRARVVPRNPDLGALRPECRLVPQCGRRSTSCSSI